MYGDLKGIMDLEIIILIISACLLWSGFLKENKKKNLGTTATHSHKSFIIFLNNIITHRTNVLSLEELKIIIFWDNSSIHKSNEVKRYLNNSK